MAASTSATTSFLKKGRTKVLPIPGTKPSLHNSQLLISTGIPSVDHILGGGGAVGTVLLVEEDYGGRYCELLLRYLLADGVVNGHALLVASISTPTQHILKSLPAVIADDPTPAIGSKDESQMEIAWRYQHLPSVQSVPGRGRFGHYFDLSKPIDTQLLAKTKITTVDSDKIFAPRSANSFQFGISCPSYDNLFQAIQNEIKAGSFHTSDTPAQRNILRIAIHHLGSAGWNVSDKNESEEKNNSLLVFLLLLRAILRQSYSVCMITIPTYLYKDELFVRRIEHLCDTVIRLESFEGTAMRQNPLYKEYRGLFHVVRIPKLNSLTCSMPETLDLAFKVHRKKFTVEKLHLPPDLSDSASRSAKPVLSCGGGDGSSKLDF